MIAFFVAGCGEEDSDSSGSCDVQAVFAKYECTSCHDATPGITGGELDLLSDGLDSRLVNAPSRNSSCGNELLVDVETPQASLLLQVVAPERYAEHGDPNCRAPSMPLNSNQSLSAEDVDCLERWVVSVADGEDVRGPAPFDPAPVVTAVNKAKYLLHGGAVTEDELTQVTGQEGLDAEALKELIDSWVWDGSGEPTAEFDIKLRQFVQLALQQDGGGGTPAFMVQAQLDLKPKREESTIDRDAFAATLANSFLSTARDIIAKDRDLRQLVTTRRWYVTTAILTALVHADHPSLVNEKNRIDNENKFAAFAHFQESDYTDWRYVDLGQADDDHPPTHVYENTAELAAQLRATAEGDTVYLHAPRVGFFNTFMFFDEWEANPDNQFRVTTSQALITALDAIFSTGDATKPASLAGLDAEHSAEGSACYSCHSLLDPMREVFAGYYDYRNRSRGARQGEPATFAFVGQVVDPIDTMDDLASAMANHPRFATAWTQKLCMWANSQRCDESGPEFERVAETFRTGYDEKSTDDDFRMSVLLRELFSSTLITGATRSVEHESVEFIVSATRYVHFCQALNARLGQAAATRCEEEGLSSASCIAPDLDCRGGFRQAKALGEDEYSRGVTRFTTPSSQDPVYAIAVREACTSLASSVVGAEKPFSNKEEPRTTMGRMARTVMGLPPSHPRYEPAVEALLRAFQILRENGECADGEDFVSANEDIASDGELVCGKGQGSGMALQNTFIIACSSPDLVGMGF